MDFPFARGIIAADMLKVFRQLTKARDQAPAVPDGTVAYAVGDIHGRADLLEPLLRQMLKDAAEGEARGVRTQFVFLGDYGDRGPSARKVVEALIALSHYDHVPCRFLRGNHDQILLDFLSDAAVGVGWFDFGGRETLVSYGVTPPQVHTDLDAWETARQALVAAMPPAHVAFLRRLPLSYELGDYFFAHAGARPGTPLDEQSEQDLLWIRQPFLQDPRPFSKIVVHGHTPTEEVHADRRRIGLDTGAYATGVLSALRLEGDQRLLIQARKVPNRPCEVISRPI